MKKEDVVKMANKLTGWSRDYKRNDLDCPVCKNKMWDTEPRIIHVFPKGLKQKRIHCNCGYKQWLTLEGRNEDQK